MIHTFASLAHYAEHLDPIWQLIPDELRGTRTAARVGSTWGTPGGPPTRPPAGDLCMVGSFADYKRCTGWPIVYVEHGAGQAYGGDIDAARMPGYAGGDEMDRVVLFVCPSITVAARWRSRYPAAAVAVVGCPRLDRYWPAPATPDAAAVAVTFHWDAAVCPESRGAWRYYDRALPALVAWAHTEGVRLLGHGHPRMWGRLEPRWRQLGVEPVRSLNEVMERATVLVADNTSAAYEFATLDRPVVNLNAPWWRRDVEHGLRFWTHIPGVQVEAPADLVATVAAQVANPDLGAVERRAAVEATYAHRDGTAARRAASAIMEILT